MHAATSLLFALASAAVTLGAPSSLAPVKRAADTTTVNLGACSGSPQLFGQGVLYGMSGTNTPPQKYVQELGINYESAGGAQTDQNGGYANSRTSYNNRFAATVAAWKRIRAVNGVMIVKMADLYGVDFTQSNSTPYPGDNGDWTLWNNFLQQVISDLKSNGMANSYTTQLEIWNEPDINFGGRPQSQYNEMYVRGTKALRQAFPSGSSAYLPLVGPSTSSRPYNGNGWWNNFLSYLQNNGGTNVQPDVWNWHLEENNNNDPIPPAQYLPGYVKSYGLTPGIGLQNNEFGIRSQQYPAYATWFQSRYERLQFNGLRGNWASGSDLSDLLADLLIKNSDGSYSTTGEYQAYKYYKLMNGSPCTTTAGSSVDSYATASTNNATAIIGSQSTSATTNAVTFSGISKKFGSATTVKAQLINIPYNNGGAVNGWTNSGSQQTLTVSNDQVTFNINVGSSATKDAWAVRLFN